MSQRLQARAGRVAFWVAWPALWVYFRLSERTRILLHCGPDILVVRSHFGNGKWGLPGGGLHRGEAPLAGALRELREETGIELPASKVKPLLSNIYRDRGFRFPCHYFVAELPAKPSTTRQKFEVNDLAWLPPRELTKITANIDVLTACTAFFGH